MKKQYSACAFALLFGIMSTFAAPRLIAATDQTSDVEPPTVNCLNGLSVNIMPTGMISLWTTDFLLFTEDNETPADQIRLGIRKAGTGTGFPVDANGQPVINVIFNCSELGNQAVELWAIDLAGNASFCQTAVVVQDNAGNCGASGSLPTICTRTLCGFEGVEEATLLVNGSSPFIPPFSFDLTDNNGCWNLNAIPTSPEMVLTPTKDDNPLNGVTSYDLVLIGKHVRGIQPFTQPWQFVAADANRDNMITLQDSVELVKLILGIYQELPNNTSWRFVRSDYLFPWPNPLSQPFPEHITVGELPDSASVVFYAIKIGDLTCPFAPVGPICTSDNCTNEPLDEAIIQITLDSTGGIFTPPLFFSLTNQNGCSSVPVNMPIVYPFTISPALDLDPLNGVNTYDLILLSQHVNGTHPFTESWQYIAADINHDNLVTIEDSIELHKLIVGIYTELPNNSSWRFVPADYVFPNLNPFLQPFPETVTVTSPMGATTGVEFNGIKIGDLSCGAVSAVPAYEDAAVAAKLAPNPTTTGATLSLTLKQAETVRIQVRDISGKMVFELDQQLQEGRQTVEIPGAVLSQTGVYGWNVLIGKKMESGKLIRL